MDFADVRIREVINDQRMGSPSVTKLRRETGLYSWGFPDLRIPQPDTPDLAGSAHPGTATPADPFFTIPPRMRPCRFSRVTVEQRSQILGCQPPAIT